MGLRVTRGVIFFNPLHHRIPKALLYLVDDSNVAHSNVGPGAAEDLPKQDAVRVDVAALAALALHHDLGGHVVQGAGLVLGDVGLGARHADAEAEVGQLGADPVVVLRGRVERERGGWGGARKQIVSQQVRRRGGGGGRGQGDGA